MRSASPNMTNKHPRLLLWDIDGTLITTGAAGQGALRVATAELLGGDGDLEGVEIAGRTDPGIVHQILKKHGAAITNESVAQFLETYLRNLPTELLRGTGRVMPGVLELLTSLKAEPNTTLGLLTGNIKRGAELKLSYYGLWHFFEFGAFADDHHDRNELGPFARRRAQQATGFEFEPEWIDVIGDTPHDIACGKAIGARTIGVATGSFSREQLASHGADFVFDDLSRVEEVAEELNWRR
jgi:phosphoglycolate phosphatase-like HAD superfamily hydrolase